MRASSTNGPLSGSSLGPHRSGRPVSRSARSSPSTGCVAPTGKSLRVALHAATSVSVSSDSKRISEVGSAATSHPISRVTVSNSSSSELPRATSVATRRSAACSSASSVASERAGTRTASSASAGSAM